MKLTRETLKQWKHALWALYLPVYLALFFFCERVVTKNYWVSYLPIDDKIPFLAPFVVPYYLWSALLVCTGLYLLFKSPNGFRRYMQSIALGFTVAAVIFLVFPNGQDLRPAALPDDCVFCRMIAAIYSVDTNTNVLPSVHVLGTMAAISAVFCSELPLLQKPWLRALLVVLALLINASTVFIKQHSLLDLLAGLLLSVIVHVAIYTIPAWVRAARAKKRTGELEIPS